MKIQKAVFALILCVVSLAAWGQISIGPRVGLSSSSFQVDDQFIYNGEAYYYADEGSNVGIHFGLFGRLEIKSLFIQPELLFTSAGGKVSLESPTLASDIYNLKYNRIDIPILVGFKFAKLIRLEAGPCFSYILSDDARYIDALQEAKLYYQDATIGYQAGVGFDIGDIYIDLKYEGSLSNIGSAVMIGDTRFNTDMRNSMLMLVVGYNLL